MMLGVSEHQAGTVNVEDRMSGADDLMQGILHAHLAEAELAELSQGLAHIVHRDIHRLPPHVGTAPARRASKTSNAVSMTDCSVVIIGLLGPILPANEAGRHAGRCPGLAAHG